MSSVLSRSMRFPPVKKKPKKNIAIPDLIKYSWATCGRADSSRSVAWVEVSVRRDRFAIRTKWSNVGLCIHDMIKDESPYEMFRAKYLKICNYHFQLYHSLYDEKNILKK